MSNLAVRSATGAVLLVQLVLSCVAIVASVGIVCAQFQSKSSGGVPLYPSPSLLFVCGLSFVTLFAVILGMFSLSWLRPLLLFPIILASAVVTARFGLDDHLHLGNDFPNNFLAGTLPRDSVLSPFVIDQPIRNINHSFALLLAFLLLKNNEQRRTVCFITFPTFADPSPVHKVCLLLFNVLQLALSISQLLHNSSLLLALRPSAFHHEASRLAVQFSLFINLCWSLSVIATVFGLARHNAALILPHLCLSFFLLPYQMVNLFVLILSASFPLSIANVFGCAAVVAISIPMEWLFLKRIGQKKASAVEGMCRP
uniref:Uncharacterized protein n=1 Tax=Globodera rostochiensis TaxID=31243 RepID=A0A914H4L4_GLORO